ncbi:MAG: glycosyltransferase family 9 protein [Bacteroidota bacterium]
MLKLPEKILVMRLSSIGDIVLVSPLLRILRESAGKNSQIDFVVKTEFAELVFSNHNLSLIHEYDSKTGFKGLKSLARKLKKEKYDLVIDLHDNLRTKYLRNFCEPKEVVSVQKNIWERFQLVYLKRNTYSSIKHVAEKYLQTLKDYGIKNDNKGNEIFIPDTTQFGVSSQIATLKLNDFNKVIGICAGAKHFTKRWLPERFAELAINLSQKYNAKIFLFGGVDDAIISQSIFDKIKNTIGEKFVNDFTGKYSLLQTAHAFEYCDLIISNDTGLMHLASAKQKPIVAIFGSSVKEFGFYPFETKNIVIENKNLKCRPCSHIGKSSCPENHFKCMLDIPSKEVEIEAEKIL